MYCKDCRFVEVKEGIFLCRFLPPFYHFPVVQAEDFCGQFQAVEKPVIESEPIVLSKPDIEIEATRIIVAEVIPEVIEKRKYKKKK